MDSKKHYDDRIQFEQRNSKGVRSKLLAQLKTGTAIGEGLQDGNAKNWALTHKRSLGCLLALNKQYRVGYHRALIPHFFKKFSLYVTPKAD
ncbi:hypothetical protein KD050_20200 [Psychrobacillus sp. INOP01]|uniref:hypothetical protein n=1 Tax=Psychrobacillus sp. INOP01 TaxID=2829187 RepID=UPI001BA67415|nr:hypothetical protein [Psychrobacillus sp. INOP01]QUG41563.1 hypothetical protein KD050_20200 [Psychrobacillus sp. INOP01]